MINLRDFFLEHVDEKDYYYKFRNMFEENNMYSNSTQRMKIYNEMDFEVFDVKEAIAKFRKLCQPNTDFTGSNRELFYLLTYYLNSCGYKIKEFPELLERPPMTPNEFVEDEIKAYLVAAGKQEQGKVPFASRRKLVGELSFEIKSSSIELSESINQRFIDISTRQAPFNNMSDDEKLAEIVNYIEYVLKKDGEFIIPQYEDVCCGFIDDEIVKNYRKKLQIFRHCSEEAINERKQYSDKMKKFLIEYGILIVKAIDDLMSKSGTE